MSNPNQKNSEILAVTNKMLSNLREASQNPRSDFRPTQANLNKTKREIEKCEIHYNADSNYKLAQLLYSPTGNIIIIVLCVTAVILLGVSIYSYNSEDEIENEKNQAKKNTMFSFVGILVFLTIVVLGGTGTVLYLRFISSNMKQKYTQILNERNRKLKTINGIINENKPTTKGGYGMTNPFFVN